MVNRCGVFMCLCREVCVSSGEGDFWDGTYEHLPMKSSTNRVQEGSTYKQVRQPVLVLCCLLKLIYAEGQGMEMVSASSFFPGEGSPCLLLSGKSSQQSE